MMTHWSDGAHEKFNIKKDSQEVFKYACNKCKVFSTVGNVLTNKRNRVLLENVNYLVCLQGGVHENLVD